MAGKGEEVKHIDEKQAHAGPGQDLFSACLQGDVRLARRLLSLDHNINEKNEEGQTPLFIACQNGNEKLVQELITRGSALNIHDHKGQTALCESCKHGQIKSVQKLLSNNCDTTHALHTACQYRKGKIVKILLAANVDVNARNADGDTALHTSCRQKDLDVIKLLVMNGANPNLHNNKQRTALQDACRTYDQKILEYLLQGNADPNVQDKDGVTCLNFVCANFVETDDDKNWLYKVAKILLAHKADVHIADHLGRTPIWWASSLGYTKIVNLLISKKANPQSRDKIGETPFLVGCRYGNLETVQTLLHHVDDVNASDCYGRNALWYACHYGQIQVLNHLISLGLDVNKQFEHGETPLFIACESGDQQTVALLLQTRKVKTNLRDRNGLTALSIASFKGHFKIVERLLIEKCDANIPDKQGQIPLHKACMNGHAAILKQLLPSTKNPNAKDVCLCTPLHLACDSSNPDAALELLLCQNLDVNCSNKYGKSPLHEAVEANNHLVVKKLLVNHANVTIVDDRMETPLFLVGKKYKLSLMEPHAEGGNAPTKLMDFQLDADLILTLLKSFKANPNARNIWGRSPLHSMIENQVPASMIAAFLLHGPNINLRDYQGLSPLHIAASKGYNEIVECLIRNGANLASKDKNGSLPIHYSASHPKTTEIFLKHMSEIPFDKKKLETLIEWKNKYNLYVDLQQEDWAEEDTELRDIYDKREIVQWVADYELVLTKRLKAMLIERSQPKEWDEIYNIVTEFLGKVQRRISMESHPLTFVPIQTGSVREGTKVFQPNDIDLLCVVSNFRMDRDWLWKGPQGNQVINALDDDPAHLRISFLEVFSLHDFYKAITTALGDDKLLKLFPNLFVQPGFDITSGKKNIDYLHLRYCGDLFPELDIHVKLVPCVPLQQCPSWCREYTGNPPSIDPCHLSATWNPEDSDDDTVFELRFSIWEAKMFEDMPQEMVHGLRLAKRVTHSSVCPTIENIDVGFFVTSYLLKTCILKEYLEVQPVDEKKPERHNGNLTVYWANRIYHHLSEAFTQKKLYSVFIPRYNLLQDPKYDKYQDIAVAYAAILKQILALMER